MTKKVAFNPKNWLLDLLIFQWKKTLNHVNTHWKCEIHDQFKQSKGQINFLLYNIIKYIIRFIIKSLSNVVESNRVILKILAFLFTWSLDKRLFSFFPSTFPSTLLLKFIYTMWLYFKICYLYYLYRYFLYFQFWNKNCLKQEKIA